MKDKIKITIALVFIIMGCNILSEPSENISINEISEKPTMSVTSTPTMSTTSIPTITITRTQQPENLMIYEYASYQNVVDLSELGMADSTRLLVIDLDTNEILSITNQNLRNRISIYGEQNITDYLLRFSPDHKWFAYQVFDDGLDLWISSADGSINFLAQKKAVGPEFYWIDNEKIIIYYQGHWEDCPSEMQILYPFANEMEILPYIFSESISYCFPTPIFKSNSLKGIFLTTDSWMLYDYETELFTSILPGKDKSVSVCNYYFSWEENGLSFACPYNDYISYALGIKEEDFLNEPEIYSVALPEGTENYNTGFAVWNPIIQEVGINLIGTNDKNVLGCELTQTFALIDLSERKLNNYCINRYEFDEQQVNPSFINISYDNQLMGWTVYDYESNSKPIATVILNTRTGFVTYLNHYELLGFTEIVQE